MVHSPFTAAFTPGTRFVGDDGSLIEIETRVVGDLAVPTGRLGVSDPFTTAFEQPGVPLVLRAPVGTFPVELAIARYDSGDRRVACARVCLDRAAPAVRWQMALTEGQPTPDDGEVAGYGVDAGMGSFYDLAASAAVDEATSQAWLDATERNQVDTWTWHVTDLGAANVVMFSTGWGDGFYASWWGFDAADRPVELVTDFELLVGSISERIELALPLPRGRIHHPLLEQHELTLTAPLLSRTRATLAGSGTARIELSDGSPVEMTRHGDARRYHWKSNPPGVRLIVSVMVGVKPLDVMPAGGERAPG
ncbi:MAG TPA: DUF4241 domain-containing protein [Kofleriaceae bacterium]|jgi:hypothetical protein|nr:DUF4241 domain-containing protein [Kofleriaceae bacterium]